MAECICLDNEKKLFNNEIKRNQKKDLNVKRRGKAEDYHTQETKRFVESDIREL